MELYLAFVGYNEAFDSLEIWVIIESLQNFRIDSRYTELLENIYKHATSTIRLHSPKTELKQESEQIGLTIDIEKTKIMNRNRENQVLQIQLEGKNIELVDKYVYLGQQITVGKYTQTSDLNRKIKNT